jgi:hypothetical protein
MSGLPFGETPLRISLARKKLAGQKSWFFQNFSQPSGRLRYPLARLRVAIQRRTQVRIHDQGSVERRP